MPDSTSRTLPLSHLDAGRLWPSLAALLLGAFLLIGVGFAHSSALHNIAHDTRHSAAFPCH